MGKNTDDTKDTTGAGGTGTDQAGNENLGAPSLLTPGGEADLAGTNSNMAPIAPGTVAGSQPAINPLPGAGVDPAKGSIDTSGKAQESKARAGKNTDEDRVKIGDTFTVVNLLKGHDLVNPHAAEGEPREFPFNTPVKAKVDGFLHAQFLSRRVRLEK